MEKLNQGSHSDCEKSEGISSQGVVRTDWEPVVNIFNTISFVSFYSDRYSMNCVLFTTTGWSFQLRNMAILKNTGYMKKNTDNKSGNFCLVQIEVG